MRDIPDVQDMTVLGILEDKDGANTILEDNEGRIFSLPDPNNGGVLVEIVLNYDKYYILYTDDNNQYHHPLNMYYREGSYDFFAQKLDSIIGSRLRQLDNMKLEILIP